MTSEMLVISKVELQELKEQVKALNDTLSEFTKLNNQEVYLTRPEVEEKYGLTRYEVSRLFNKVLRDKVIKLGRKQKLAVSNIEEAFKKGTI